MEIYALVLNWNGIKDTLECINSLKDLNLKPGTQLHIVVVDNCSADGSVTKLLSIKGINLLQNSQNLGYTGGNNAGITYILTQNCDFVWILNSDLTVDKNSLNYLLEAAQKHTKAGIISPKIYFAPGFEYHQKRYQKPERGKVIWYAGGKFNWGAVIGEHLGIDLVDNGEFSISKKIEFASGASLFIHQSVLRDLRGFDNRYFLYLEDVEFSFRARQLGFEVWFEPRAILWHKNSRSSEVGGALQDYYISRNRLLIGMKYSSLKLKLALIRESIRLLLVGRKWQKRGIRDFYFRNFGKGSFTPQKL